MWQRFILPSAAVLALVIILTGQSASAEPFQTKTIGEIYTNEFIGTNPDGGRIYKWTSSPQRILDGSEYKDYILFQDANIVRLETANAGSIIFNKNTCSYNFHNPGYIDELNQPTVKNISWTVKGKLSTATQWSNLNGINGASCNVSVQTTERTVKITGEKANTSGTFQIVIDYSPGRGIKETMRAYNNNPAWNNHHIGFTETFEVPRMIKFGNHERDLANYNGTTLNRTWIENNQAKVTKFTDKLFYDFGIGYDNLESIKISWDGSVAKLSMNYLYTNQIVPYQTWFEVDPTFGYTSAQSQQTVYDTTSSTGATCNGVKGNGTAALTSSGVGLIGSGINDQCFIQVGKFIITSIPDTAFITSANFRHDRGAIGSSTNEIPLVARNLTADPQGSATAATKWTQGTTGNHIISAWTEPAAGTNDIVRPFNSNGTTYIQSQLDENWVAFSVAFSKFPTRDASTHRISNIDSWELEITYVSSPPPQPLTLTATSQARKVQYTWTISDGSGVTTYYRGLSLNNVTFTNKTSFGNVTSYLDDRYYRPGLLYYANITASNGLNSTSKYTSFTMDDYPSAPQNLYRTLVNSTTVKLNWSPPSNSGGDTITGYRVERATGFTCTGSFTTLINHTTALNYNNTGLSTSQQYCYRVAAWNGVGMSGYSNNVLRFRLPDPVNDLSITAVGLTNVDIAWSTPGLNGGTLSGYQINYTTPSGAPLTIISNNTLSATTAYSVTGLTQDTDYCFRVGAWTQYGIDPDGNIECATTYVLANFTIGFFDVNSTNPEQVPIRYERSEINSTATNVKVIYPNSADLDCLLDFSFAQTQESYENITGDTYDVDQDYEDFVFANSGNDIITIDCTNSNNNDTARYVVTQEGSFVLLEMIRNFRTGEYGTMGFIGSLDLITVLVVIISMIGFNRVSGQVGIIFNIFFIGTMSYFEIIDFDWVWLPALVLIAMVVILSTRKD